MTCQTFAFNSWQCTSKVLLSLHALTGSDTTGKFDGKSKQFWFRRFLTIDQNDSKLKEELVNFQTSKECTEAIESFVCRCYLYRSNKDSFRKLGEAVSLSSVASLKAYIKVILIAADLKIGKQNLIG